MGGATKRFDSVMLPLYTDRYRRSPRTKLKRWMETMSIHDARRRAPLHFEARADNARFIAYMLYSTLPAELVGRLAESAPYGGSPEIAMFEGFSREAALALELIVKAVIAQKLELQVAPKGVDMIRMTHDLPRLWKDADLPTLPPKEQARLLAAKRIQIWSGRYAAPKSDADLVREDEAYKALFPRTKANIFSQPAEDYLDWDGFDGLYQIAAGEFWGLRRK
jgi:hypothetical protein